MAEVTIGNRVYRHETKDQPTENAPGKIVEAFGLRKCPKLVEQVRSDMLEVRVNTLRVLCDEFRNPTSIAGVVKAGLMRAMVAAARDYNGRTALLEARAPETVFPALNDDNIDVRRNIYEALANASTTGPGMRALVQAGYPAKLVGKAVDETPTLQPLALKVLCNVIKNKDGLEEALAASMVETLIKLLGKDRPPEVQREACATLTLACSDDVAKIIAIQNDGVTMLAALLEVAALEVRAAAMGALMMITTVDAGKRAILSTNGAEEAVKAMHETDDVLLLNSVKLVASIAAHPDIRSELKEEKACLPAIRLLQDSADPIIAKHASIALEAVLWQP